MKTKNSSLTAMKIAPTAAQLAKGNKADAKKTKAALAVKPRAAPSKALMGMMAHAVPAAVPAAAAANVKARRFGFTPTASQKSWMGATALSVILEITAFALGAQFSEPEPAPAGHAATPSAQTTFQIPK